MKKWNILLALGTILLVLSACQSYQDGINAQTTAIVPQNVKLAKIKPDMTKPEVAAILGEPDYCNETTDSLLYVPLVGLITGIFSPLEHEYYYYNGEGIVKFQVGVYSSQAVVGAVKYDPSVNFKENTPGKPSGIFKS